VIAAKVLVRMVVGQVAVVSRRHLAMAGGDFESACSSASAREEVGHKRVGGRVATHRSILSGNSLRIALHESLM